MRIEARIRARLLGLPLLRLDAEIALLPAQAAGAEHAPARVPPPREVSARPGSILARAIALTEQSGDSLRRDDEERPDDPY